MSRIHTRSLLKIAAERNVEPDDLVPTDLIEYDFSELPPGPPSELGGEVQNNLMEIETFAETKRLAKIGRAALKQTSPADKSA